MAALRGGLDKRDSTSLSVVWSLATPKVLPPYTRH